MSDTTFEEARRCPRCESLGVDESHRPGPHGSSLHIIKCLNNRCRWYNTTYIVQVEANGSVRPPDTNRHKFFPKVPDRTDSVSAHLENLYKQTLEKGEIRNY